MSVPPWVFFGAALVLLPLFVYMAVVTIERQKENSIRLLVEKGAALIRSFEAGTRTGFRGGVSGFQLQHLLTETAEQPDIVYLLVADLQGEVLACSDPRRIGSRHGEDIDLNAAVRDDALRWRRLQGKGGTATFEVYRRFKPGGVLQAMGPGRMMMRHHDGFRRHPPNAPRDGGDQDLVIFVGLDMESVEQARRADTVHTVVMAAVLLLLGFAGVVFLLVAQGYRATRASLSRIRVFSDTLVEHMPIGLVALDPERRVAVVNHVAGSLLQISASASTGKSAAEVLPDDLMRWLDEAEQEGGADEREVECRLAGGRVLPLEAGWSALTGEDGEDLGRVILFKDLSEVRFLRKEVERNRRLASVGRLAAGVAHEIRNPLSSIKGFATYFKERYVDVSEDQEIVKILIGEVERVNRVIGQLLEFARPVALSRSPVDLEGLLTESVKQVERQVSEKGCRIRTRIDGGLAAVSADPDRLRQVLLNLYLNALEAMEEGGTLGVSAERAGDGSVRIRVSDTGHGIEADQLPHIFDPYFTTKASGTGLGLAIAHNILEAHGGTITVDSEPGRGTRVSLVLPEPDRSAGKERTP